MKAIGIDIGTAFIAGAKYNKNNIAAKFVRDGFFTMPYLKQRELMLRKSKVPFIVKDRPNVSGKQDIYVIGNEAFDMAVLFGQTLRRPLASGVISAAEKDTEFILKEIIRRVAEQGEAGDVAYYSVPADPVDKDFNIIYHREMFKRFLSDMGYQAIPLNEGMAVAYSELDDKDLTGLSMSCLPPGQKVISNRGFVNIEEIIKGDKVLTKAGKWEVCAPTSREYSGKVYDIWSYGGGRVKLTEDHQVWVFRDGGWSWVAAKNVVPGDLVKQPWENYNFNRKQLLIFCEKRKTSSKKIQTVSLNVNSEVCELIGYFLGDGHIQLSRCFVGFTFHKDQKLNCIERVLYLIQNIFGIVGRTYEKGPNCVRVGFDCLWFAKWLDKYCFDNNRRKMSPWSVSELSDSRLRFILKGLVDSDGTITKNNGVVFDNTSPRLAQFVYLSMLRLGMAPSFYCRAARVGGIVEEGRQIIGKQESFTISSSGFLARCFVDWVKAPFKTAEKSYTFGDHVSKIISVEEYEYTGPVYDVAVQGDDHSFCVPGIAIHNCGAGMTNIAMAYKGLEIFSFSIARGGDWLDEQVAKSRGISGADATAEKESETLDLLAPDNDIQEAISIFYKAMLEYVIGHVAEALEEHRRKIKLKEPLSFVVAGGTSMPKNFLRLLANALKENPFPIPVGKVWKAKNPVMAVCRGCLRAAQAELSDDAHDGVKDISEGQNKKHSYPKAPKQDPAEVQKDRTPKEVRKDEEKAEVMSQGAGGFAEAIDLEMET